MIVVLALLGIVLTFATLDLGGGQGQVLEDAARELAATATLVEQESILRRRPLGIAFYRNGYRVVQFDAAWSAPHTDRLYRRRYLPAGIDVVGAPHFGPDDNADDLELVFVMFPDGDTSISELILADTNDGRSVELIPRDGRLRVSGVIR